MKFKFNWGHGITLFLVFFVLFIGNFVFKAFTSPKYDYKLTSEKYYEEELNYQDEIESQKNAKELTQDVFTRRTKKGLEIVFPSNFDYSKIKGHLKMLRNKKDGIDIEKNFTLTDSLLLVPEDSLAPGRYNFKMDWEYKGKSYQLRKKLDY